MIDNRRSCVRLSRRHATRPVAAALLLIAVTAAGAAAQRGPVRLALADGAGLSARTWTIGLVQDVALETGADTHIVRDARLRFRLLRGQRIDADRSGVTIGFDSARAAVSSPHGREVIDARPMLRQTVELSYSHAGGRPSWEGTAPGIDFGDFGGVLPAHALIEFLFPVLPAAAVRPGDGWDATSERRSIDGNRLVEEDVMTRYTLERLESAGGSALARVTFATRRPDSAAPIARGFFVLGVDDGILREVSIEETVPGTWSFGGEDLRFRQTTSIHALLVGPTGPGLDE